MQVMSDVQFSALLARVDEARASAAAAQVREKHAATIATVVAELEHPATLPGDVLVGVLMEAGGAGLMSPFFRTESAGPAPAPPPEPSRPLHEMPLQDFLQHAAASFAAPRRQYQPGPWSATARA